MIPGTIINMIALKNRKFIVVMMLLLMMLMVMMKLMMITIIMLLIGKRETTLNLNKITHASALAYNRYIILRCLVKRFLASSALRVKISI